MLKRSSSKMHQPILDAISATSVENGVQTSAEELCVRFFRGFDRALSVMLSAEPEIAPCSRIA